MKLMKRYATACLSFLTLAVLALAPVAQAQPAYQQGVSQDAVIEGVLNVKFSPSAVAAVEASMNGRGTITQKSAQGVPQTGLASVDQVSRQFGVTQMQRIFRPAGKYEARHRRAGLHRWYKVRLPKSASLQAAVQAFGADPNVTLAEYELKKEFNDGYEPGKTKVHRAAHPPKSSSTPAPKPGATAAHGAGPETNGIPNDPRFDEQWHFNNTASNPGNPDHDIDLPEARNIETGSAQVIVSMHDAAIDIDHEDLAAHVWVNEDEIPNNNMDDDNNGYVDDVNGYDFVDDDPNLEAGEHGTHTSGTVGAVTNNGIGVAGVAGGDGSEGSGVRLMSLQVFNPGFFGASGGFAESYSYAADNGSVISANSWGYTSAGSFEQAVLDGIDYYIANAGSAPDAPMQGGLVVFSAGNTSGSGQLYPGYYDPTIAVASTNINDELSGFSSYGTWVDVSAPGGTSPVDNTPEDVLSTLPGNAYGFFNGTSMASPHVSGTLGLIVSTAPGLTNDDVRAQLESTTDDISAENPGFEDQIGTGRINAFNAVSTLDANDDIDPGTIDDLAAMLSTGGNNAELTWTAPSDDAMEPDSGAVGSYQVAYSTDGAITDSAAFANATLAVGAPVPSAPGTEEGLIIENLDFDTQYWFAVKAIDDNANTSLSNSPSVTTNPAPELAYSPDTLRSELDAGADTTVALTLENTGPASTELAYSFPSFAAEDVIENTPARRHNDTSRPIEDASYTKGEKDPYAGVGNPVTLGAGGPDAFGYEWIDSNEPGGPTFNWFDISDVGTSVDLGDDFSGETSVEVNLPFNFDFYAQTYASVRIDHNGFLFFDGAEDDYYTNDPIPTADAPNAVIAPFWDDLDPPSPAGVGSVYYYDDAASGRFIVQWDGIQSFLGSPGDYTFQVILDDNGSILFQYLDMEGSGDLSSATVGIENAAGDVGLQVAFNTSYVEDGLAVALAAAPDFITDVEPASGSLAGGNSETVDVTFDAAEIDEPGLFEDDVTVETNDPESQIVTIPAELLVSTGPPDIAVRPDTLDFGGVVTGETAIDSFYVVNDGGEPLEVTAISASGDTDAFEVAVFPPSPLPIDVPADDSVQVNVSFEPTDATSYAATVTLGSDDPDGGSSTVELTGEGIAGPLVINEILADPPSGLDGDANGDGTRDASEDEFIEIANVSDAPFDVSGYTISDDVEVRHTFPEGTVLEPGVAVVVFGGGDPAVFPGLTQTASSGLLGFSNGGDSAVLEAADGSEVATVAYGSDGDAPAPDDQSLARDPDFVGSFVAHSSIGFDHDGDGEADLFSPGYKNTGPDALPVEISAFDAEQDGHDVVLSWSTASETNNAGFYVEQKREGQHGWTRANDQLVEGAGTSTEERSYSFRVGGLRPGAYTFRLEQVDFGSVPTPYEETVEATVETDGAYELVPASPNPFRSRAKIQLDVGERQDVTVDLYNTLGQRVRRLYSGPVSPGQGRTITVKAGALASGVYFYRIQGDEFSVTRQLVLVK